jgi:RNA polymerase sigma-70 factor (TIGR02957 family)
MADSGVAYGELRPLMFSIAYRMLGTVTEAEDVVQEAFMRLHAGAPQDLRSPEAYAATVTTRLAIDALRSARHRREHYVGPWLPEPLVEAEKADPAWQIETDETVSVAFLMMLEKLSPAERAVFLLREVFGYTYAEVAGVIGKSETACRQVFRRARQHIQRDRSRFVASAAQRDRLAQGFFAASRDGDLAGLERLLADDVTLYGDGGGQAPALRQPVHGPVQVARFVVGLGRQAGRLGFRQDQARVNGQPGAVVRSADGAILAVVSLGIGDDQVSAIYNQINPGKLGHLGAAGDLAALLAGGQ